MIGDNTEQKSLEIIIIITLFHSTYLIVTWNNDKDTLWIVNLII